jgi:hypothetical protein
MDGGFSSATWRRGLGVSETRRLDDGGIVSVHAIAKQRSGPYFDEQVRRAEFEMSGNGSTMQQQVDEMRPVACVHSMQSSWNSVRLELLGPL